MRKIIAVLMALLTSMSFVGCSKKDKIEDTRNLSATDYSYLNLSGTDAVGRKVATGSSYKEGQKHVGVWYSFWLGQHPELQKSIQNIQSLLDQGAEGNAKLKDLSDAGQFYFWGEPLYGYYNMQDPWVLTRHIELLTMAGADFICVDATNQFDYLEVGKVFLPILRAMKNQGFKVPSVCFYTNTGSGTTANRIYENYYKSGEWDDLWYAPNGRPLIVGITENNKMASDQTKYGNTKDFISPTLQRYFEVKESEWPNGVPNDESMPWMSWDYPQIIHNGYIAVPVAQHGHETISASHMAPESHRGYDNIKKTVTGDYREGLSFQQMWDTVFKHEDEITTVLVCSWNEWMAQKQSNGDFVDVYNWEYSRDMEMMKGGYGDNFYLQLCQNIRKFKLTEGANYKYPKKDIHINAANLSAEFEGVISHYKDFAGDAIARDFSNAAKTETYTDNSNRNDITDIKVAHDGKNLYFYVQTKDAITAYNGTDKNWMNILIGEGETKNTFAGYKYVLNRSPKGDKTSLDVYKNGAWESAGEAELRIQDNVMVVSVPLASIGKTAKNLAIEFKVSDNVTNYDDIMDYYVTGDSAPIGRLSFSYGK